MRLFITTMIILFLAFGNSNAQNNKTFFTKSFDFEYILPCTDDYAWGIETIVVINWQSKTQGSLKGTYEGESGKHYSWSLVSNQNWKPNEEGKAANYTWVSTGIVEYKGVQIALYKIRFHATLNANCNLVFERYTDSVDHWICI